MYPLAVLSLLRPRFAYILGHYGHARSQGGHQPAAAKSPMYCNMTKNKSDGASVGAIERASDRATARDRRRRPEAANKLPIERQTARSNENQPVLLFFSRSLVSFTCT